jgi:hypothetical protein
MSLPASQQRVLDAIEDRLARREPRLASMFAMFTRLATGEALPRREAIDPAPWWSPRRWSPTGRHRGPLGRARAAVLLTLAAALIASVAFLSMSQSTARCAARVISRGPLAAQIYARGCPPAPQARSAAPQARSMGLGHVP